MTVGEIMERISADYPAEMAMSWDNCGLQVGRTKRQVKKIFVALDATEEIVQECASWEADLLVTHHPLMLSGIKKVNDGDFIGRKILAMAEHGIAHYAMHTNYDVITMANLAGNALGMKNMEVLEQTGVSDDGRAYGIGCVGELPREMTAGECCEHVKRAFGLASVRLFGDPGRSVRRAAVCPGSGKSVIGAALASRAELLVTGDIGHHDGLDALDQNLMILDAGHYGVEHIFIRQMADYLKKVFPELEIRAAEISHPFTVL